MGGAEGQKFWIGAWGVRVRGLPAPLVYAMWRPRLLSKKKGSGVVMERIHPASPLANYVHSVANCPRALKELLESLAELLKNMHAKGVYHRDMKASNILVRKQEDMLELFLLDLEDVCFKKRLSVRDRLKNLAQLDSSVPSCIGDLMRLRFLAFYARGDTEKEQLKRWARSIRELSIHMRDVG